MEKEEKKMRKTRNQLLVFIATALVALVMAVPAFATSTPTADTTAIDATATSTANLTVKTGNANDALSAYKVVNATLDTKANTLTYTFTDSFKAFQEQSTVDSYKNLTPDEYCAMDSNSDNFKALLGAYSTYIKTAKPTPDAKATTDGSGVANFTGVGMGQYVILGSGNTTGAIVYQTVTAEVVPTISNGKYVIYPSYDVAMKTTTPSGEKTLDNGVTKDNYKDGTIDTASIGDTLTYTLHGTVPTYSEGATNTTYYMGDTLSSGLTLASTDDQIVVKGYAENDTTGTVLTLGKDYTVKIDGQNLYIDYVYSNIKGYSSLTATYNVILNDNAKIGTADGNPNTYTLVWSNSPFDGTTTDSHPGSNTPGYGSTGNTKIVYTYALYINKYEEANANDKLAGAVFAVYDNAKCTGTPIATVTTDSNGYAAYTGLEKGTYYLKEVTAPTGYKLLTSPVEIDLSAASATSTVSTKTSTTYTTDIKAASIKVQAMDSNGVLLWLSANATGENPTASATQPSGMVPAYVVSTSTTVSSTPTDNTGAGSGYYPTNVSNAKGGNLPTTGGMGTTLFYIIGALLVIGAIVALVTKKRMADKQM